MGSRLYLPVRRGANRVSIAICLRCQTKVHYDQLMQDPNDHQWYCRGCVDLYDPYRLPARRTEDISLTHPRPEVNISVTAQTQWDVLLDMGVEIDSTVWDYGATQWDVIP